MTFPAPAGFTLSLCTASRDEVVAIVHRAFTETLPPSANPDLPDMVAAPERVERVLASRTVFEARAVDGALAAVGAVHLDGPGTAHLSMQAVLPRRSGLGTALCHASLSWARAVGAHTATACTQDWNTASIANLRASGFEVARSEPDAWSGRGELVWLSIDLEPWSGPVGDFEVSTGRVRITRPLDVRLGAPTSSLSASIALAAAGLSDARIVSDGDADLPTQLAVEGFRPLTNREAVRTACHIAALDPPTFPGP